MLTFFEKKQEAQIKISFLLVFFLCFYYFFISLWGYGNDDDIFRMINSGLQLIHNGLYEPSRFQGYLIPELVIGASSGLGGFYLSNIIAVLLGVATLALYYSILREIMDERKALLAILIIGFNPYFVISASSSMDYIYSLFFMSAGIVALYRRYYLAAAFLLAFTLSSRLSHSLLVFLIYIYFIFYELQSQNRSILDIFSLKVFYSAVFSLILTILLYFPVYMASGYSFGFLSHYDPGYDWFGYLVRFLYKNIAMLGFLATVLFILTFSYKRIFKFIKNNNNILLPIVITAIIIEEILFFYLPYENEFLLPVLLLIVPLYVFFARSLAPVVIFLGLTVLYNVVNVDILDIKYIADPNEPDTSAESASIGLVAKPGIVLEDVRKREDSGQRYAAKYITYNK